MTRNPRLRRLGQKKLWAVLQRLVPRTGFKHPEPVGRNRTSLWERAAHSSSSGREPGAALCPRGGEKCRNRSI